MTGKDLDLTRFKAGSYLSIAILIVSLGFSNLDLGIKFAIFSGLAVLYFSLVTWAIGLIHDIAEIKFFAGLIYHTNEIRNEAQNWEAGITRSNKAELELEGMLRTPETWLGKKPNETSTLKELALMGFYLGGGLLAIYLISAFSLAK